MSILPKLRTLLLLIGLVLLAVFIWYGGPFFAFGVYRPLETELARMVAIALVVGGFILLRLARWLRLFGTEPAPGPGRSCRGGGP